ncbi:MAG: glycosyltransferase family 4 protein [Melioribacteraceae bacterium]|jgi:glycosyltransferase involved in cell wall biosynthesis|nr:glycosyltransferase family 4 protein [Melioribacteraceae bacterium]
MKILVANWRCIKNPEMGGAEIHFHEIFKLIVKMGHEVTLVVHSFTGAKAEETIDGIKIYRVGSKFVFKHMFKRFYKKHLAKNNYDLIVDDISKIPMDTPRYIKKPIVGILHHIHGSTLYKEIPWFMAYYISQCEKLIPKYYSKTPIFTVSPSTKNELAALGQPEEKIDYLYNAIDQELFENTKVEKSETPLLVYVGRIKKYKQVELVVDVLPKLKEKYPDIELHIGGSGDHTEELKKYVVEKGLKDSVKFLGFLSEENKAKLLGRAWVFVTMAMKEGWGITVIEANAMNTPVIGSDVPGLRDSIKNEKTGYLVKIGNETELVSRISELIDDKEKRNEFSRNAKEWSLKFSWQASADHFIKKVKEWYPELS